MTLTDDELKEIAQAQARWGPQPGEIYRHYKGGLYVVTARSLKEDTLEPLVTYRGNAHGTHWTRFLANFVEDVFDQGGGVTPRFSRVED
jgi:hypothetical protein